MPPEEAAEEKSRSPGPDRDLHAATGDSRQEELYDNLSGATVDFETDKGRGDI